MAAIFESPESFEIHVGKDLLVNGRSIFSEVKTAVADYKKADFEGFGENIGEAAAKTILGAEKLQASKKGILVVKGILEGAI
jgi:hypothetical protein